MKRILVTGSLGQIGSDLTIALADRFGKENIVGFDHKESTNFDSVGSFEQLDVLDAGKFEAVVKKYNIGTIYHLVSILSAKGEDNPELAWRVNIKSLKNVFNLARKYSLKIFWPSSIAAFGSSTPKNNTPQQTILEPNTMYGVTKVTGELLCNYYFEKYDVDVRSLRYPGIISYKTKPGGGATDYAIEIYHDALQKQKYTSFVRADTVLPMMYMPDAIKATLDIMNTSAENIKTRFSYNITAMSFSAKDLEKEIKKHIPEFVCEYQPDKRQEIVDSWPKTIDDSAARNDWGWKYEYDLSKMTDDMIEKLRIKLGIETEVK